MEVGVDNARRIIPCSYFLFTTKIRASKNKEETSQQHFL